MGPGYRQVPGPSRPRFVRVRHLVVAVCHGAAVRLASNEVCLALEGLPLLCRCMRLIRELVMGVMAAVFVVIAMTIMHRLLMAVVAPSSPMG